MEDDLHWNFQVNVTRVFDPFSGLLVASLALILVWFERSLHRTQVSYHVPTEVLNPLIGFDEVQVLETPAIHLVN